jgi:hypothetical protein
MAERFDHELDERLNLYLDGRLSGAELEAFERRMRTDPSLRRAVEFHRGLILDFREEDPPLPPGFAERARARLQAAGTVTAGDAAARIARAPGGAGRWSSPVSLRIVATAAAVIVLAVVLWPVAQRWMSDAGWLAPPSSPMDEETRLRALALQADLEQARNAPVVEFHKSKPRAAEEPPEPDEETLQALRSLGYLASGKKVEAADESAGTDLKDDRRTAEARPEPALDKAKVGDLAGPAAGEYETRAEPAAKEAVVPTESTVAMTDSNGAPESKVSGSALGTIEKPAYRIVAVGRAPELGRDHEVIETPTAWRTLFSASGDEPPAVDFRTHRAVLLRDRLGSEPPWRLRVLSIASSASGLSITCRVERASAPEDDAGAAGQAVILGASDLPVRIVVQD